MVAVTHDVNIACFLAGRGIVTSFTEETWPHYLDAVVIVRDRNHDFIEYGWLRHVDSKSLPVLILEGENETETLWRRKADANEK